jgi:hypothetical protein
MNAIAYALFGYGTERQAGNFDFHSYLRGFLMNIRLNRCLFPGWENVLETDKNTFMGHQALFEQLNNLEGIRIVVNEPEPLTKAMLWRLKPVFEYNLYDYVLCRDLDSPTSYREAQAVQDWINGGKAAHAITDSISHGIPMLGGMIGFRTGLWPVRSRYQHWAEMFYGVEIDFSVKGADQTFLNKYVYPKFGSVNDSSICQHYCLGMPNTFLDGYKNHIPDIAIDGVPEEMRDANDTCSHIGQSGHLLPPTFKFLKRYQDKFTDILEVEKQFPDIAYWVKDGTFN